MGVTARVRSRLPRNRNCRVAVVLVGGSSRMSRVTSKLARGPSATSSATSSSWPSSPQHAARRPRPAAAGPKQGRLTERARAATHDRQRADASRAQTSGGRTGRRFPRPRPAITHYPTAKSLSPEDNNRRHADRGTRRDRCVGTGIERVAMGGRSLLAQSYAREQVGTRGPAVRERDRSATRAARRRDGSATVGSCGSTERWSRRR
jgi:hypothetical protein